MFRYACRTQAQAVNTTRLLGVLAMVTTCGVSVRIITIARTYHYRTSSYHHSPRFVTISISDDGIITFSLKARARRSKEMTALLRVVTWRRTSGDRIDSKPSTEYARGVTKCKLLTPNLMDRRLFLAFNVATRQLT